MEIKKEVLEKSKVKLTIKLSPVEMRGAFARVYNRLAPQVEIKGFRPGMAPKSMVVSAVGENRLQTEIINEALQLSYPEALKKENLIPVAPPEINIKMLKDLTNDNAELEYEAQLVVLPEIKVGNYKKIRVKKDKKIEAEATKEEVDQVLSHLAREQAEFIDILRPIKIGDRVEINFEGFEKNVKLENLSSKNYPIILGSNVLIPEFEERLVGMKKGEKSEFRLDLKLKPEDKERKKVDFKVEILEAQEVIKPEINDDFAKKYQKSDLKDLRKAINDDVIKQKKLEGNRQVENQVIEELLKITQVDVPEVLIHQEIDRQIENMRARLEPMGMTFEQYLANMNKNMEAFRESLRPQAERAIKVGLALGEIIKEEKIDPKDKEAAQKAINRLTRIALS